MKIQSPLPAAMAGLMLIATGCGQSAASPAPPASSGAATSPKPAASGVSAKPAASAGASAAGKPAPNTGAAGSAVPKTNGQFAGGDPNGTPVKISYASPAVSDTPYYAAVTYDFFKQQHLNVTMIQMAPNVALPALSKGEIDFTDSPGNTIEGASRGLPFKIVFSAWTRSPWTLYGKKEFNSMADLKGHTIGTNLAGSSPYIFLQAGIKKGGLAPNDVKILSSPGTQVTFTQLLAGQMDAAVLSPPFDAQAEAAGFHEILFLGDLLQLPYVGLGTNTSVLNSKRPMVVSTIKALLDANAWLKGHIPEATGLIEQYSGAPPDIAKKSAEKMMPLLTETGEVPTEGVQQALDIQAEVANTKIDKKPADVVDWGPLHDALGKG
jgi:ABC-type nitrate/sulfonate/bicarbonate transport system substrate-binding protein